MKEKTTNWIILTLFILATLFMILFYIPTFLAFYPGETIIESNPLGTDKISWLIEGNTSEITILPEVTYNSTDIIIYFPQNMPPNSFNMIFFEEQTNEIIKEVYVGGGGSGGTKTVYKNNTIYEKIPTYVDRIVNNETIKEVPVEGELIQIAKPFYLNLWFYLVIALLVFIITMYILNSRGE